MRRMLMFLILAAVLAAPVSAAELTAPTVPESAREFMPSAQDSFGMGLLEILKDAAKVFRPDLAEAASVCLGLLAAVMVISVVRSIPGVAQRPVDLAGTVAVGVLILQSADAMVSLGTQTVAGISEYGRLLLPVMTTALAAQGGVTSSVALYTGTVVFDTVLSSMISKLLSPMIWLFLALSVGMAATGEELLKKMQGAMKWLLVWSLKTILYIFTGYIGITGVVSGTTDAAALKAAKLTISGVVPVVGGILSDASEAVLVGAGTVKNAVGIYGMLAILAIWMGPFLKLSAHYLLLKATAAVSSVFGSKQMTELIGSFAAAMGLLLAMTGSVCLMLMISTICFMKGVG